MANTKQLTAAKKNIKKAQKVWRQMTSRQHAMAQPQGRTREKPGEVGGGNYYRIQVRNPKEFVTFRYHDVGKKGGDLQRLAGKKASGSWDTQAWLISKNSAHIEHGKLIGDTQDVLDLLNKLGSEPLHVKGDVFKAKDRPDIPEVNKPTEAQRIAQMKNIHKAQQARWAGMAGGRSSRKGQ